MEKLDFGKKLIEVRKAKGLTQDEVAEKCNVTVRTIQRIESGSVKPRAFTIKVISNVLEFDFFEMSNTGCDINKEDENSSRRKRTILWYIKDLFNFKKNAMKKISILTTILVTISISIFMIILDVKAQPISDTKIYSVSDSSIVDRPTMVEYANRIEVTFSNNLHIEQLVDLKEVLYYKGVTLHYKSLSFDEDGRLSSIHCKVKSDRNGSAGSLDAPQLNAKKTSPGFYFDYSPNAESAFGIGNVFE